MLSKRLCLLELKSFAFFLKVFSLVFNIFQSFSIIFPAKICRISSPSRVKPMTLKLVFTSQPSCLTLNIKRDSLENKPASYLLCRWEKHIAGFSCLGVADRWLVTLKEFVMAL